MQHILAGYANGGPVVPMTMQLPNLGKQPHYTTILLDLKDKDKEVIK
jgi:hypothetical protein